MAASQAQFASASLYVGDLHKEVTEAMLYEVFNSVGPVASIRVCRDSSTRRSLGYAYVNYHSVGDAERALDTLNYTHIKNVPCRIMWSHRDPSLRKSGAGNIFVKNLDKSIDNKALYDTFSLFGNILSCKVAQDEKGNSRGFGFVHYETEEAAETAIERVNSMKIGSKTVYVGPFRKASERISQMEDQYTNIYVKNIPEDWDEDKLKEVFSLHGEVSSLKLQEDARKRRAAFVNFTTAEAAKTAVEKLNQMKVSEGEESAADADKAEKTTTEGSEGSTKGEEKEAEGAKVKEGEEEEKGSTEDEGSARGDDPTRLYVTRFQSRAERVAMLRSKFDQSAEQRQKKQGVNLYIKNIHDSIDDAALRELFERFGTITSAKVMLDENGVSRGFGFVSFLSPDEATKAVTEMHLQLVESKPLYVGLHEKREDRMQRLQQKMRVPHMRPRMPSGIPPQIQFGAPQMYFNVPGGMQQPGVHMGFPSGANRAAAGGYPPAGMIPWSRGQPPLRAYGPGQQPGMPPQMNVGYAPVSPIAGGQAINPQLGQMPPQVGGKPMPGGQMGGMAMQQQKASQGYKYPSQGAAVAGLPSAGGVHPMHELSLGSDILQTPKQMLGEKLFPAIARLQPNLAGKITGMMLDMENSELLALLESETQLKAKVDEALRVLQQAGQSGGAVQPAGISQEAGDEF